MDHYLQGVLTIFSLVNPVICAQIFIGRYRESSYETKLRELTKAILVIGFILAGAAFFGARLLHQFGISLDAFQVAGGIVLIWMGFNMLSKSSTPNRTVEADEEDDKLIPLILFAASPGTITGVITLAIAQSDDALPRVALSSIGMVLFITWIIVAVLSRKTSLKPSMTNQVTTRFMGLIVLAMGVQFALSGIMDFTQNYPH